MLKQRTCDTRSVHLALNIEGVDHLLVEARKVGREVLVGWRVVHIKGPNGLTVEWIGTVKVGDFRGEKCEKQL